MYILLILYIYIYIYIYLFFFFFFFFFFFSGVMTIQLSKVLINNCSIENSYSELYGAVFYSVNNNYFEANNINVYNTTAYYGVCLIN